MKAILSLLVVVFLTSAGGTDFKSEQLKNSRVKTAYKEKESSLKELLKSKGLQLDNLQLLIQAFKEEQEMELWGRKPGSGEYTLIKTYSICALSGDAGPKRKEGDGQIPEGFYKVSNFNPYSSFYLSLQVNYPNASDKILSDSKRPGGLIFIHGACVTIGCLPMTDEMIKEIYVLAVEAKNRQNDLPVYIFPARLSEDKLKDLVAENAKNEAFWKNLKEGYDYFRKHKKLPKISVDKKGKYLFS